MPDDSLPLPITDVPQEEVGNTVQGFIDFDEVKKLEVKAQPNGNFTVTPKAFEDTN